MEKKISEYLAENDIYAKLRAAVDMLRNSGGDAILEGLQNGKCTVDIVYNGAFVFMVAHTTSERKPDIVIMPEPLNTDASVADQTSAVFAHEDAGQGPAPEPEKRKRRQYTS